MACERVQFSKKTHGDGAGIVRKLDANRKRILALRVVRAIKTISGGAGARARAYPEKLHDTA
jgi:hypothetical protein